MSQTPRWYPSQNVTDHRPPRPAGSPATASSRRPFIAPFPSVQAAARFQRVLPYAVGAYLAAAMLCLLTPSLLLGKPGFALGVASGLAAFLLVELVLSPKRRSAEERAAQRSLTRADRRFVLSCTAAGELAPDDLLLVQEVQTRRTLPMPAWFLIILLCLASPLAVAAQLGIAPWLYAPLAVLLAVSLAPVAVFWLRTAAGTAIVNRTFSSTTPGDAESPH